MAKQLDIYIDSGLVTALPAIESHAEIRLADTVKDDTEIHLIRPGEDPLVCTVWDLRAWLLMREDPRRAIVKVAPKPRRMPLDPRDDG